MVADEELRMSVEHAVRQQVAQARLRPAIDDASDDEMEVGARIHIVRDRRCDHGEDLRRTMTALIAPREEPVFAAENKAPQLALTAIVRGLDVAVVEKEKKAMPLPVEVAECFAEW